MASLLWELAKTAFLLFVSTYISSIEQILPRPALSHLTSGKLAQARKRLTPGAKKRIMKIDICFTAFSQAGF